MRRESKFLAGLLSSAIVMSGAIPSFGQQKPNPDGTVTIERQRIVQGPDGPQGPTGPGDTTFVFVSTEMNFDGKLVTGAPYSAQAVTETTQILSDGNRIVNKSTSAVYRDSEGRTRREHTLTAIGPFVPNAGEAPLTISINDPVAGVNYALDPRTKVAHKMSPMRIGIKFDAPTPRGEGNPPGSPNEPQSGRFEMRPRATTAPPGTTVIEGAERHSEFLIRTPEGQPGAGAGMVMEYHGGQEQKGKTESLGKQNIEGVEAEGSRTTVTIPAGEIGNERAIEIVSERWYSPELQVVVMTKHSDPRFGETSYRLTSIDRSEPAKSLFEVPADYTIQSPPLRAIGGFDSGAGDNNSGSKARLMQALSTSAPIESCVLNGKPIKVVEPSYSDIARHAGVSGTVPVEITIDEAGNVTSAHAVSGHPLLQAAAVDAARKIKFAPTKLSGPSVKNQCVVTYTFGPAR